jgi:hypothetical protein
VDKLGSCRIVDHDDNKRGLSGATRSGRLVPGFSVVPSGFKPLFGPGSAADARDNRVVAQCAFTLAASSLRRA